MASLVQNNAANYTGGPLATTHTMASPPSINNAVVVMVSAGVGQQALTVASPGITFGTPTKNLARLDTEIWVGIVDGISGTPTGVISFTLAIAGSSGPGTAGQLRTNVSEWNLLTTTIDISGSTDANSANPTGPSLTPTNAISGVMLSVARSLGAVSAATGGFTSLSSTASTTSIFSYRIIPVTSGAYQIGWTAGIQDWSVTNVFLVAQVQPPPPPKRGVVGFKPPQEYVDPAQTLELNVTGGTPLVPGGGSSGTPILDELFFFRNRRRNR